VRRFSSSWAEKKAVC